MGKVEDKPVMAMIGRRSDLSSRATLVHGTSPRVFVNIHGLAYRVSVYLASLSMGSAMGEIKPAATSLISFLVRYEKVKYLG
ncbi:hypothetical protein F2Q69_00043635 [Brassica cretica]|uniref:Uncharacterized protein n=1 Tax=Brassica cretica TaxID=69181 RepID=A0A8S9N8N6_BRACR|nr:hypothetical protein F2Q69_00043635 [Brassica cretica]